MLLMGYRCILLLPDHPVKVTNKNYLGLVLSYVGLLISAADKHLLETQESSGMYHKFRFSQQCK